MLFPVTTNNRYTGLRWLPYVLLLLGMGELIPSLIHGFAPDGGAFSIAGIAPTAGRVQIIGIFAWAGATQLVWALTIMAVALRYRDFIPAVLLLMLIEKSIIALNGWLLKPAPGTHHPPALYIVLLAVPILGTLLLASLANPPRTP
jgi:hypothetical protein